MNTSTLKVIVSHTVLVFLILTVHGGDNMPRVTVLPLQSIGLLERTYARFLSIQRMMQSQVDINRRMSQANLSQLK